METDSASKDDIATSSALSTDNTKDPKRLQTTSHHNHSTEDTAKSKEDSQFRNEDEDEDEREAKEMAEIDVQLEYLSHKAAEIKQKAQAIRREVSCGCKHCGKFEVGDQKDDGDCKDGKKMTRGEKLARIT